MLCYITCVMLCTYVIMLYNICYVFYLMLYNVCYITYVMLCYITYVKCHVT